MTKASRVRFIPRRGHTVAAVGAIFLFLCAGVSGGTAQNSAPPRGGGPPAEGRSVNSLALALKDFEARLQQYLELRERLASRLKPLSPTADAADLTARQESLAAALQDARKGARQGDLIPPLVAAQIARAAADDFRMRGGAANRAALDEVPAGASPLINKTYPRQAALPTFPALLLSKLPRLPDNLQYRFFARHIVILDGDTQIIVDYIPGVLPPH